MEELPSVDPESTHGQSVEPSENQAYHEAQTLETLSHFPLVLYPREDAEYITEVEGFLRNDVEDFKRIIHAHLLSSPQKGGWAMEWLKNAVRDSYGYEDVREVDKFVKEHYKYQTFKEFVERADDIAEVDEHGNVTPFLDHTNRQLYMDAVESTRNKDEKDRKKVVQIERTLEDPANVADFYKGMNRLRQAITQAIDIHGEKEYALAKISAMDGTDDTLIGINASHVQTEYQNLFNVPLPKDCKKICGRSTLMKALATGKPKCLLETIAMENKMAVLCGEKQGMYIALRKNSHHYTDDEILEAVEECRRRFSDVDRRKNERENREARRQEPCTPRERPGEDLRREMRQQMERQRNAARPPSSSSDTPIVVPPKPLPTHHNANNTVESDNLNDIVKEIPSSSRAQAKTNGRVERNAAMPQLGPSDEEFDDGSDDQQYSDDEDGNSAKVKESQKKKQKKEDEKKQVTPAHQPESSPPPAAPLHRAPLPSSSSAPPHDEAAGLAAMNLSPPLPATRQNANGGRSFQTKANNWDEEYGDPETVQQRQSPPPQQQQQQQVATPSQSVPQLPPPPPNQQSQPVQQGQQVQLQPQPPYGQEQQQAQHVQQQFVTPPTPGGLPIPPPSFNGDGMQANFPQQMPMQGQWPTPGATPSQSQLDYGAMPNHSQAFSQGPLPSMVPQHPMMQQMQQQPFYPPTPYHPQYPNGALPPHMQQPGNPPTNQGYPGAAPGTGAGNVSPVINVMVNVPPQGPEQHPMNSNQGQSYQAFPPSQIPGQLFTQPPFNGQQSGQVYPPQSSHGNQPGRVMSPLSFNGQPLNYSSQGAPFSGGPQYAPNQGPMYPGVPQALYQQGGGEYSGRAPPLPDSSDYHTLPQGSRQMEPMDDRSFHGQERRRVEQPNRSMPQNYNSEKRPYPNEEREQNRQRVASHQEMVQGSRGRLEEYRGPSSSYNEPQRVQTTHDRGFRRAAANQYEEEERRRNVLGRPQGASTPINRSQEGDMWQTDLLDRLDCAKKRIRWQVISILKNVRDRNYRKINTDRETDYELVEEKALFQVVEMGLGDDMELYEVMNDMKATAEYYGDGSDINPFREFLREMEMDNLIILYTGENRKTKESIVYVMDPYIDPPKHFNIRRGLYD